MPLQAGAHVIAQYNRHKDGLEALNNRYGHCEMLQADLSNVGECQYLMEAAVHIAGNKLEGVVNNAGVAIGSKLEEGIHEWVHHWDFQMNVNLRAPGIISREYIYMRTEKGLPGRLVHIASRAAFRGDTPEYMAYAASKAGVVALSRSIARGFGKKGIKSFVIAPGFVRTDMSADFIEEYGESFVTNDLALDSLTLPDDVAPMVVFLLSGLADHATGCTIDINAGSYVH